MTLQIDDRSGQLAGGKSADRGGYSIKEIILHETSGGHDVRNAAPDLARQLDSATISWFLTDRSDVSVHYLIGGENLNAPIYRLCPESRAAYHAIGNKGSVNGFSVDNHISIGIERMGQPWDNPGPNQTRAMCELAFDICQRHNLKPEAIISHASIQSDRTDGNTLLVAVREYVRNGLLGGINHVADNQPPKPAPPTEFDPNPNNFNVGPGVLERAKREGLLIITSEQYYIADPGQPPGLTKRSFTWAGKNGNIYMIVAIEDQGPDNQPLPTWTTQVWLQQEAA
jgi:hypothetical protein